MYGDETAYRVLSGNVELGDKVAAPSRTWESGGRVKPGVLAAFARYAGECGRREEAPL
jgi:hypothetical protein